MRKQGETTPTEALAAAVPEETKTKRKPRASKPHAFLLTDCQTKAPMAEFAKNLESDAVDHAREILATAEPGTYLLTKQVATLTVSDITTRKVARG